MGSKGVYQSDDYKKALLISGEKVIQISEGFFVLERTIKLPGIGIKKIVEGRGNPSEEDLVKIKKLKCFYATISPCVVSCDDEIFEKRGFKRVSNYTMLVDLKKTEEELWKILDKGSIRWGVNYAKKNELRFGLAESERMIDYFYELYEKTAEEGGFKAEKRDFIKSVTSTDIAKLFVVKRENKILAGGVILIDKLNNYSILDLTSVSGEGMKMQAMPFLYWNLILYSKSLKFDYFDLGGYDKEAKEGEKTWNINKFKERFGGEIKEQPIYASNWRYSFFRGILRKFRFLKGAYRKE